MEAWKWLVGIGAAVGGYLLYERYKSNKRAPSPGGTPIPAPPPPGSGGSPSSLSSKQVDTLAPSIPTGIPQVDIPSYGLPEGSKLPGDATMATVACTGVVPGSPPKPAPQTVPSTNPTGGPEQEGKATGPDWQWIGAFAENDTAASITLKVVSDRNRYVELLAANPHKKLIYYPEVNFESMCIGERFYVPKSWNPYIDQLGYGANGLGRTEPWPS